MYVVVSDNEEGVMVPSRCAWGPYETWEEASLAITRVGVFFGNAEIIQLNAKNQTVFS